MSTTRNIQMKFTIYIFLLFFPLIGHSQKEKIKQLESELTKLQGADFAETALELADQYYQQSMFQMSERRADNALEEAKKIDNDELIASAYFRKGMVLTKTAGGKKFRLNAAFKNFEQSNRFTSDEKKRIENLKNMQVLAQRLRKTKELEKINTQLANLGFVKNNDSERISIFNKRKKKAEKEFEKLQSEKEKLSEQQEVLQEEISEMAAVQNELVEMQEGLINQLQTKELAIVTMSDEQMKKELILSEKERLLDSFTFVNILDSLELSQKGMLLEQQKMELREQDAELQLQTSQRNFFLALAGLFTILVAGLSHRFFVMKNHNKVLEEKNKIIQEERERSEKLLLNILPKPVADELKLSGVAETQYYETATVMFVDFKGFSKISKQLTPQQLVSDLDHAFKNFDAIIEKYKLEKIKTIGDAYMCAGGLPNKNIAHPKNVVQAAIEIQKFLVKWNNEKAKKREPVFEARIGIHTGPLVAGVVGSKKFAYDIWGDTVNVAARMETGCEAGKVNISNTTFKVVKDNFNCEYRGKVPAKNVGEVEMYYVNDN